MDRSVANLQMKPVQVTGSCMLEIVHVCASNLWMAMLPVVYYSLSPLVVPHAVTCLVWVTYYAAVHCDWYSVQSTTVAWMVGGWGQQSTPLLHFYPSHSVHLLPVQQREPAVEIHTGRHLVNGIKIFVSNSYLNQIHVCSGFANIFKYLAHLNLLSINFDRICGW